MYILSGEEARMQNWRKKMSLWLAILMTFAVLSACSSGNNGGNNTGGTASPQTSDGANDGGDTVESLPEVTLKIFVPGEDRPAKAEVLQALYELTKDRLNAKFEINTVGFGDYQNKLTMLASSGDNYDAAFTADWFGFSTMVNKKDLTELMPKYAPELYKYYVDNNMLASASVNGKIMAVPWTEIKSSKPVFQYRADIAEQLGVQPGDLSTIEGIDAFLTEIAGKNPGMIPYDIAMKGDAGDIVTLLMPKYGLISLGVNNLVYDINDPAVKIKALEETEMFKEAVALAKKWYDSGVISKNALADKENNPFESGKAFAKKDTIGSKFYTTNFTDKSAVKAVSEVYPDAKYPRDSQMNNAMAINANAANPERMLMFMELLTTDREVYDMFFYGIQDKTYTLDDNGVVGFVEGEDPAKPLWQNWFGWGFLRAQFARPSAMASLEAIEKTKQDVLRPNIGESPIVGFVPSTEEIKTELALRTQISTEQGKLLLSGVVKGDIDQAITDYVKKQKDAGTEKIVTNIQAQVDAFLASK
jgi:putative aldouronate transport system substrate-binding protein